MLISTNCSLTSIISDVQCSLVPDQRLVLQLPQAHPLHHPHPRHRAPRQGHDSGEILNISQD